MKPFALLLAAAVLSLASVAQADPREVSKQLVLQCMSETRAPGAYALVDGRVLAVKPGEGGTQAGARNVNDCLLDKRGVQFSTLDGKQVTSGNALIPASECRRERNSRIALGLVLTVGTVAALGGDGAVVGGIAGSAVGIRKVNKDFRNCLALAGQSGRSSKSGKSVVPTAGCRAEAGTIQRGSNLCVGY